MKEPVRPVFQLRIDPDDLEKLRRIAIYRGSDMSSAVRAWIRASYAKLPREAK